jgi:acetyltransferase-like isoleucine patch superfamily enzyme
LIIKDNCRLNNTTLWLEDNNNCITIGDNTTMEGGSIAATEGTHIILGNDCMLSFDVDIRSGDSHGIFSSDKGRLNPAGNIMIGNHVWVGAKATILKEAAIPDGCIIGHSSLVTKKFTSQRSIYAGNPAKFIKENIIWSRNKQLE